MTDPVIIFGTFLPPAWYKTYLYITEYVERSVHIPTFLLNGETLEDFSAAYIDAGFINGFSYIQMLSQRPCPVELIAAPVLQDTEDREIAPSFFDIVVRRESNLTSLRDLEGCVWAYHAGVSHVEDRFIYEQGTPLINFREMVEAGSQAQALHMVLDGKADAAAINSHMLDIVLRNSPRMAAKLRLLGTYSYAISPLVVVATRMPFELKREIQQAFLNIHQDAFYAQRLQESMIERFIPVNNTPYQSMRERRWRLPVQPPVVEAEEKKCALAHMP